MTKKKKKSHNRTNSSLTLTNPFSWCKPWKYCSHVMSFFCATSLVPVLPLMSSVFSCLCRFLKWQLAWQAGSTPGETDAWIFRTDSTFFTDIFFFEFFLKINVSTVDVLMERRLCLQQTHTLHSHTNTHMHKPTWTKIWTSSKKRGLEQPCIFPPAVPFYICFYDHVLLICSQRSGPSVTVCVCVSFFSINLFKYCFNF